MDTIEFMGDNVEVIELAFADVWAVRKVGGCGRAIAPQLGGRMALVILGQGIEKLERTADELD